MLKWDLFSHQVKVFLKAIMEGLFWRYAAAVMASDNHTDLLDDIRIEVLEAKRGMTSIWVFTVTQIKHNMPA